MSVQVSVAMKCTAVETIATNADSVTGDGAKVTHNVFDFSTSLNDATTVPVTKVSAQVITLSSGAAVLDLTALTGINGGTVNATGLKLQVWKLKNLGANTMTFSNGASNSYGALGTTYSFVLASGQRAMFFFNEAAPDVASNAKNIAVAGTGSQTFQNEMIFG